MSSLTHALGRSSFGNPANKGNLLTLEEAHALLAEWVPNERLRLHMKQVGAVMKAWALEREDAVKKLQARGLASLRKTSCHFNRHRSD